jgi:hypothetical protein
MNAHSFRSLVRRRSIVLMAIVLLSSLAFAYGLASSVAQESEKEEREVEDKIPKHLPIKVKIKKPDKVKDLKNDDWFGDLEVEITNTGSKPIYFLSIALLLPDVLTNDGRNYGYKLRYGRVALAAFEEPVRPDDVPILPGESVTVKGHADEVEGWKRFRAKGKLTNPKKLEFKFQEINHGDGTGFVGFDGTPIPIRKERSSNVSCGGGDKEVAAEPRLILHQITSLI